MRPYHTKKLHVAVFAKPLDTGFRQESWALFTLGLPLIANNIIMSLMTFIDFVMAGKISSLDLAAVGIGGTVWAFVFLAGMGVMMAMNPIAAQHEGAGEYAQIGEAGRQSLWLALLMSVLIFIYLRHYSDDIMRLVGIKDEIIPKAYGYLRALAFGSFAVFGFLGLRYVSEGIGHTKPIMYVALIGLVVNATGNYVLMFGNFGAPKLGVVGCGYATAIAMWVSLISMLIYIKFNPKVYGKVKFFERFDWPQWTRLKALLKVGLPIGGSVTAEVGLFSAAGLIMGTLSATEAAAHAVAINYASTMFMVPLALHSAIMIRVGQSVGSGRPNLANYTGWVGIILCTLFMTASALVLLVFREPITTLYVDDEAVRQVAAQLLLMAMLFQIVDGIQVGAAGAVRGLKDTTVPMIISVFSFWVIGLPVAWYAGTQTAYRGQGVWGGLVIGLAVASVLLLWRFHVVSRRYVEAKEALN